MPRPADRRPRSAIEGAAHVAGPVRGECMRETSHLRGLDQPPVPVDRVDGGVRVWAVLLAVQPGHPGAANAVGAADPVGPFEPPGQLQAGLIDAGLYALDRRSPRGFRRFPHQTGRDRGEGRQGIGVAEVRLHGSRRHLGVGPEVVCEGQACAVRPLARASGEPTAGRPPCHPTTPRQGFADAPTGTVGGTLSPGSRSNSNTSRRSRRSTTGDAGRLAGSGRTRPR